MTEFDWDGLLNWRLLSGSHRFPGPQGGTCINEAAVVAAGFEYREILSVSDCPPCFSKPLASYLMTLNDLMPDELRQRLTPFVVRLSGSADIEFVERRRTRLLALESARLAASEIAARRGVDAALETVRGAVSIDQMRDAVSALQRALPAETASGVPIAQPFDRIISALDDLADTSVALEFVAEAAAEGASSAAGLRGEDGYWMSLVGVVEDAFAIGAQADPLAAGLVTARMSEAKRIFAEFVE